MTTAISRQLSICTFADEKTTTPKRSGLAAWTEVVELHAKRRTRPHKSGVMLGGYAITGTRADANVPLRSLIQLDIDTQGVKDKATGRILEVKRAAPALDDIRSGIDEYEWCAASSHWHEPQGGVIKYRVVILPDRDLLREEYEALLEALDERLGGDALDRDAWQWSQAFYLPSCPAENEADAFFVRNQGAPLPVDEFVRRGQEIIAAQSVQKPSADLARSLPNASPPPETPENIDRAKSMLTVIDPDIERSEWRQVCWAVMATGWDCAENIARDWSTAGETFTEKDFANVVRDFDPMRGTGFGTLVHLARKHGWKEPSAIEEARFTGTGVDVENGKLFAGMFRNRLLYVHETGDWLLFDLEQGWVSAPPGEADRAAKDVRANLRRDASYRYKTAGSDDPIVKRMMAHVRYTSKANNLRAMIEMARSEPGMTVRLSEFDDDPMLLGVANGVLDLRTGTLLPVSPDVLVSKRCGIAYDRTAKCDRFEQFMREVQPDANVRLFLRQLIGYCLTGRVDEQVFAFLYGHGANGKSVFVEIVAWLLGDYARKIPTEMLMVHQRNPQGPSPDIVALKGVRFAYANETEEGRRLAEARIKELTGGDRLTGRVPYAKADISFWPSHKLIIVGNHKPEIIDTSAGMWRRPMLTPFDQTIPEAMRDPKLLEALKGEGPGILNWALAGLRDWLRSGLQIPEKIKAATAAYRDEQDILGDWIAENCDTGPSCSVQKRVLYANYVSWTDRNGHRPFSQSRLTRRLNDRGYEVAPDKRTVIGLALTTRAWDV
jgi:P4 family phage/plasmid primase-like protien